MTITLVTPYQQAPASNPPVGVTITLVTPYHHHGAGRQPAGRGYHHASNPYHGCLEKHLSNTFSALVLLTSGSFPAEQFLFRGVFVQFRG